MHKSAHECAAGEFEGVRWAADWSLAGFLLKYEHPSRDRVYTRGPDDPSRAAPSPIPVCFRHTFLIMANLSAPGRPLTLAIIIQALLSLPLSAQTATSPATTAAFLLNLAKFTQWPAEALPPAAPLIVCVLGDPAAAAALDQSSRNQLLEGHHIVVWRGNGEGRPQSCHVLFVAAAMEEEVRGVLNEVKGAPVLTVGDSMLFAETGGSVQLFRENDRTRFAVNIDVVHRQKLHLSAQLLTLAKLVRTKDAHQQ